MSFSETGFVVRMFLILTKIMLIFTLGNTIFFLILELFLLWFFIDFQKDINYFSNVFEGISYMFEFTFGSVLYIKNIQLQNLFYDMTQNSILICIAWIGNVMVINFLAVYLIKEFEKIYQISNYYILRHQYKCISQYENLKEKSFAYFPIYLNFFMILIYLFEKIVLKRNLLKIYQIIDHFFIFSVVFIFSSLKNIATQIPLIYLVKFINIYKKKNSMKKKIFQEIYWLFFGLLILLYLSLLDVISLLLCIFDYTKNKKFFRVVNKNDPPIIWYFEL